MSTTETNISNASDDDGLVSELESLIGPGLFDREEPAEEGGSDSAIPTAIDLGLPPRFQIRGIIGAGGMGQVFDAQDQSLQRRVAIKILHRRNPVAAELMRREREVLAALQHPGIVAVYDCGELPDGQPYFVMQYAKGSDLESYVNAHLLNVNAIIELMAKVARAVGVAHLLHIVHRDLKPKNIAVADDGRPMVLDFGLAKFAHAEEILQTDETEEREHTVMLGRIKGTLAYMSPEQAAGEGVDCRTDVFALGVILYQLLTGKVPVDPTESALRPGQWSEFLRRHPPLPLDEVSPNTPSDVVAIVQKCLALDPNQRYGNALTLAEDLEAFLQSKPVQAVEKNRWLYLTKKFARAHRISFGIAAVVLLTLIGVITTSFFHVQAERNVAIAERHRAEDREAIARPFLYASEIRQAGLDWKNLRLSQARQLLDEQIPRLGQQDLRGFDWFYLRGQANKEPVTLSGHEDSVSALALSPDERILASGDVHGVILFWDIHRSALIERLDGHKERITSIAFSPDNKYLAAGCEDETVSLYRLDTKHRDILGSLSAPVQAVSFSPSGLELVAGDRNGFIHFWKLEPLESRTRFKAHRDRGVMCLDLSPDGKFLATGSKDQTGRVFDLEKNTEIATLTPHGGPVHSIRFTPDGRYVATAGWDRSLRYWDREQSYSLIHEESVAAEAAIVDIQFIKDTGSAFLALANGRVPICQPPTEYWSDRTLRVEPERLTAFVVGKTGLIASTDGSTTVDVHRRQELEDCRVIGPYEPVDRMAVSPHGQTLAVSTLSSSNISLWNLTTGEKLQDHPIHSKVVTGIVFSPDSQMVLSLDVDGHLSLWNCRDGKVDRSFSLPGAPLASLALAPDGKSVAVGGIGTVQQIDLATGKLDWSQKKHEHMLVNSLTYTSDGQHLISGSWDNTVKVWNPISGTVERTLTGNDDAIFGIDVSPDNSMAAAISRNGVTVVWDLSSGARLHTFAEVRGSQGGIAFTPDSRLLAIGTFDPLGNKPSPVVLYDLRTRIQTLSLLPPARTADQLTFTKDGRRLVAGGHCFPGAKHGAVFVWESPAASTKSNLPDDTVPSPSLTGSSAVTHRRTVED